MKSRFPLTLLAFAVAGTAKVVHGNIPPSDEGSCQPDQGQDCIASAIRRMLHGYVTNSNFDTADVDTGRQNLISDLKLLWENQLDPKVFKDILQEAVDLFDSSKGRNADRFVQGYLDVQTDPDCTLREFDVRGSAFDAKEAARVFRKCRVVVLRNALNVDFLSKYRDKFTDFLHSLNAGRTSARGSSTWGENSWIRDIDVKRWEMLLPKEFANSEIVANDAVLDVLSSVDILGPEMVLHNFGAVLAEPGAVAQGWHFDAGYLFSDESLETSGIAGHDLPSYVVTMFAPLLNMTEAHGPTEFCLGSSHLQGFDLETIHIANKTLRQAFDRYMKYVDYGARPPDCWHSVELNFGDVLLFDYQVEHRGGQNKSPDLRAVLYLSYSRYWYRDVNFVEGFEEGHRSRERMLDQLLSTTRFAMPSVRDTSGKTATTSLQDTTEILNDYRSLMPVTDSQGEDFMVSNKDVVHPRQLQVYVGERNLGHLPPGGSLEVSARPGEKVQLRSIDGKVIQSWPVVAEQGQIVFSRSFLHN